MRSVTQESNYCGVFTMDRGETAATSVTLEGERDYCDVCNVGMREGLL